MRACDFGAVLFSAVSRGLAAVASTRLAAAFFATLVDLMDVLLAIAFLRRCLRYATLIEVILALGDDLPSPAGTKHLTLLWQILSGTGFPNHFFCDSWVVGFWRG